MREAQISVVVSCSGALIWCERGAGCVCNGRWGHTDEPGLGRDLLCGGQKRALMRPFILKAASYPGASPALHDQRLRSCHQAEAVGHHQSRGFVLRAPAESEAGGVFVELFDAWLKR